MASKSKSGRNFPTVATLTRGIRAGDRAAIARAITLIESTRADHRKAAARLVQDVLPKTGNAIRVGITGAPGVGKSLTIDTLGTHLTAKGHKVAVLAVDPSSVRTGGSILGDKTRMARLASDPNAFVRPSPAAGTLGGVAANTREAMLICEAAGLRRGAGRDDRHRPVGDRGCRHDRFFPGADAAGRGRPTAGAQKRRGRACRHDRGQQGRRRQHQARDRCRCRVSRGAANFDAAHAGLGAAGHDLFGAHRHRDRRTVGASACASRAADCFGRIRRAPARAADQVDVDHDRAAIVRAPPLRTRRSRRSCRGSKPR